MGNTSPTLDYAAANPRSRLRKWSRRILLAVLLLGCLYVTPIAWLYWGWKQEQPAREIMGATVTAPAGPAFLERFIPARLSWIRERATAIELFAATDDALRTLRPLNRLKVLTLYSMNTGPGRLKRLYVYNTPKVTDAGLVHLKGLTGLQRLYLDGTQVTDAGLVHLRGLTGLQYLDLADTRVTDAGVADLQKALPQCQIDH